MVAGEGHIGESVDELITVATYWHRAEAYIALAALAGGPGKKLEEAIDKRRIVE